MMAGGGEEKLRPYIIRKDNPEYPVISVRLFVSGRFRPDPRHGPKMPGDRSRSKAAAEFFLELIAFFDKFMPNE